ncbi:MAG: RIP metalloprotease RseP [Janthinobacterium lividum]
MHLLQVIVEFAVVLGVMVLVHEFGHFAVAKLCKVRVEAFAIGFGTRLFGVMYHGTDYRLNLLPLGGYVKFAGDAPGGTPSDPGEFNAHPRWQRVLIALAGPVANFILSFFLLFLVAHYHHEVSQYLNGPAVVDYVPTGTPAARDAVSAGDTVLSINHRENPTWLQVLEESALASNKTVPFSYLHNGKSVAGTITTPPMDSSGEPSGDLLEQIGLLPREQSTPITVRQVAGDTPASQAGLQPGDRILRIDALTPHSVPALLAYLKDRGGAPSILQIERNGQQMPVPITPRKLPLPNGDAVYRLGFEARNPPVNITKLPVGKAAQASVQDNAEDSTLILRVLKGMFTRQVAVKSVSGPVGMAQMIDVAAHEGYWTLLRLMSSISINLGILNLMPFPVLDGGMILFLAIEAVMRRDVNQVVKERVYQVAFVCLIVFMVMVMFNDITKLHLKL